MSREKGCVFIYYVPTDGFSWANFLQSKLNEKEYNIMSTLVDISNMHEDYESSDVNVVLVSPDICSLPSLKPLHTLQKDHSLAVLLGVEYSEYIEIVSVKEGQNLSGWPVFNTQANEDSVRSLLMKIIELYEDTHKDDVELEEDPYDILPVPKPIFPPRGVNQDQVSEKEDEQDYEVVKESPPRHKTQVDEVYDNPVPNQLHAILVPHTGSERSVFLLVDKKPVGKIAIITDSKEEIEAVRVRKEVYQVSLKDDNVTFNVVEGGSVLRNCAITFNANKGSNSSETSLSNQNNPSQLSDLDKMRELLLKQTDPVCMLCRALRLEKETSEALDDFLAKRCKNLQNLRSLQKIFINDEQNVTGSSSSDQWPTLLHFGAEYNLIKFCKELLNLPRSLESCNIMNSEKEIPFDIAHHKNHTELAAMLEQYMEQQWRGNSPGNKDSGIEPDNPLQLGCEYMAMKPDIMPKASEPPPVPHRESTYMTMGQSHVDDDDDINSDELFEDDIPPEPPTPHIKAYINTSKIDAKTIEIPKIVFGNEDGADKQTHLKDKRESTQQKSYSESDTTAISLEGIDMEKLAKLGYDVSKVQRSNKACHQSRSVSEGSEPPIMQKPTSVTSSQEFENQNTKQTTPRKSLMKKIGGIFQRKNSLADQDTIISEEKLKKRDKKKGKPRDSPRMSDVSTSSSESSTSTDNQLLSPDQAFAMGNVEEIDERSYLRKVKKQKYPMRRKSKRMVHAEKDELRIIDLPARNQEQF